jgi:hypothetical protein
MVKQCGEFNNRGKVGQLRIGMEHGFDENQMDKGKVNIQEYCKVNKKGIFL